MSDKGKRKTNPDEEEAGKQNPSSLPPFPPGFNPLDLSQTRESSQKTTEGVQGGSAGDLDSDAEKEVSDKPNKELKDKGKRIKYSDDKTGEQIPSSSPSVPSVLTSEDLSSIHTDYERSGSKSLADYIRLQQEALLNHEQMRNINTVLPSESSDSDNENEELDPMGDFICELEISDTNRLVIPYQDASGHFPDLILIDPIIDQTLQLADRHRHEWRMTFNYDTATHSFVITQGLNNYLDHYHLNVSDMIRFYLPQLQLHTHHFNIRHEKKLGKSLFVVEVTKSNRLTIPYDFEVVKYFNPSQAPPPPDHLQETPLHLIDHLDQTWEMKYICFEDELAYVFFRGWEQYVARYGLNYKDTIRFFERKPGPEQNSFIIFHEPGPGPIIMDTPVSPPLRLQMNFICQLELTDEDVGFGRLAMPGVQIAFLCRGQEMARLTDENNKNWYVIIVQLGKGYAIEDGWEGYVWEHELEAGDLVSLYSPVGAEHDKHFLIKCTKKSKKSTEKEKGGIVSSSRKGKEKV